MASGDHDPHLSTMTDPTELLPQRSQASARDRQNDRHSHRKGAMGISVRILAAERLRDHSRWRAAAALSIKALSAFGESKRAEQAMQKTRSQIKSFSALGQARVDITSFRFCTALLRSSFC
jgi:hypothetical protein